MPRAQFVLTTDVIDQTRRDHREADTADDAEVDLLGQEEDLGEGAEGGQGEPHRDGTLEGGGGAVVKRAAPKVTEERGGVEHGHQGVERRGVDHLKGSYEQRARGDQGREQAHQGVGKHRDHEARDQDGGDVDSGATRRRIQGADDARE